MEKSKTYWKKQKNGLHIYYRDKQPIAYIVPWISERWQPFPDLGVNHHWELESLVFMRRRELPKGLVIQIRGWCDSIIWASNDPEYDCLDKPVECESDIQDVLATFDTLKNTKSYIEKWERSQFITLNSDIPF